ncbi:LutC/YkgG family protein [Desulfotignum balticum]|jgi:L-lactate dehydrogenase complex protein LldG|uniref:LutC/YkgG family protein n=1 Tax=Desulfotignum balticum TaxID=115781 RepID=UPI000411BA8C|nr:lactate utilization protein [Desulfotignum balticum]
MTDLAAVFAQKATLVSAVVHQAATRDQAFDRAVDILLAKTPMVSLMPDPGPVSAGTGETPVRTLAAPNLGTADLQYLSQACDTAGNIHLLQNGTRQFPGGIDMGVTLVDFGIADTGTLVIASDSEETRLATMLCEVHVAVLNVSDIRVSADDMVEELSAMTARTGSYTAFITGASRTADIERVLAIGVHGPLELHIILVEEE